MINSGLQTALSYYQSRNNDVLSYWLSQQKYPESQLVQVMKYGTLLGGKRIRPFLVYSVGSLFGVKETYLDAPAAAIECIHAYSLIHDDLPAMDNDTLRRGKPTCHIAFDEAITILAGDALQTLGFDILASGELAPEAEDKRIPMIRALIHAAGANGMCHGQTLDLDAEGKQVDLAMLEAIHRHKTGALIQCAVRLGALSAGEISHEYLSHLDTFASAIGLAFQVQDDILDIISDTKTLGKTQGSDISAQKSTYPALLGVEGAKEKAAVLYNEALNALEAIPYNTEQLEQFAQFIIERKS